MTEQGMRKKQEMVKEQGMSKERETAMEITDIGKEFSGKTVLSQVNINIQKGEIFGLLGPSGAGKTTLIKILTGQCRPDRGSARILNTDCTHMDSAVYRRIGMVLDDSGLYERLSCYDNLLLFAEIYGIAPKRFLREKIEGTLEKVGLEEASKRPAGRLSKGMRQRLVFARALLHEPEVLFLDEPTSGLDPSTLNEIHDMIFAEREKGKTIFLTTHNMEEAAKLCDHVGLLHQGRMVEYGAPGQICLKYDHQNQIRILLKDGSQVLLQNGAAASETVGEYLKKEQVKSIHSTEPTLETVFMELTGRRFD